MKKKVLSLVSAAALTLLSSVTAFAASPTVDTVQQPVATQTAVTAVADTATPADYAASTAASDGFEVKAVSQTTADAAKVAVQNLLLNNVEALGAFLGDANISAAATTPGSVVSAAILSTVEVDPTSAVKDANGFYNVVLSNALIAAGDDIVILHYNGAAWEVIRPAAVSAGAVAFQTTSLSPVSIVKVAGSTAAAAPKTGRTLPVASLVLIVSVAGAAVARRKLGA